jgi:hypothetical protein
MHEVSQSVPKTQLRKPPNSQTSVVMHPSETDSEKEESVVFPKPDEIYGKWPKFLG